MEVGETARVHEAPPLPGRLDGAVVAVELTASALGRDEYNIININGYYN